MLYNSHALQNAREQLWRDDLNGDHRSRVAATDILTRLRNGKTRRALLKQGYSAIVTEAAPFLFRWCESLKDLRDNWWQAEEAADELGEYLSKEVGDAVKEKRILRWFWMSRWHEFALRGVVDYLECLADMAPELENYPTFNNM